MTESWRYISSYHLSKTNQFLSSRDQRVFTERLNSTRGLLNFSNKILSRSKEAETCDVTVVRRGNGQIIWYVRKWLRLREGGGGQCRARFMLAWFISFFPLGNAGISVNKNRSVNVFRKLKITDYQFLLCVCSLSDIEYLIIDFHKACSFSESLSSLR